MPDDELTPSQLEALRGLPRQARPSDLLEERTVRALAARGLLRRRRSLPTPLAWSVAAAACLVFFVAGFAIGQSRGTAEPPMPALPASMAEGDIPPVQDSTDVTLADPAAEKSRGVQHVVWF